MTLTKLFRADSHRISRFHDQNGKPIPLVRFVRNGPAAFASTLSRLLVRRYPARPWISYDFQSKLARHLTPRSRVLEFGSGNSTAWLARRCRNLISIESDPEWFGIVSKQLTPFTNSRLILAVDQDNYVNCPEIDGVFDFILIDGMWRDVCAAKALTVSGSGSLIYLDDFDKGRGDPCGDLKRAGDILQSGAQSVEVFTDFSPGQFHAKSGLSIVRR